MSSGKANKIVISGYLTKEGGSYKSWKKRWFVVKNGIIKYSKSDTSEILGYIDLRSVVAIGDLPNYKKANCFTIDAPRRQFIISALDAKSKSDWLTALQEEKNRVDKCKDSEIILANSTNPLSYTKKDFEFKTKVDELRSGEVWEVRRISDAKKFNIKLFYKSLILKNNELHRIKQEKVLLEKLKHPYLIEYYCTFQSSDRIFFLTEFIDGVELYHHLVIVNKFPEPRAAFSAAQVLLALNYLHSQGMVYRGMRPENIYLKSDGNICLTNFSVAKELEDGERTGTLVGVPIYLAPEVLEKNEYDKAIDFWALGILIFEMLTGNPPFDSKDVRKLYHKIVTENVKIPKSMSPAASSLMKVLLVKDPADRLTDIDALKNHEFFKDIDWEKLEKKEATPPYIPDKEIKESIQNILDRSLDVETAGIAVNFSKKKDIISSEDQKKFEGF
eukprot:TRINITY_DN12718_c0_g1_i1.p1 TRINITY_DN12718_c0_g1~~TRINITY_DN12718_c0_g1_i1.p1  ORF type:complete len:445 (+),score=125.50 TRINITY_DN12718_c0_g1_i1:45-1379(+)